MRKVLLLWLAWWLLSVTEQLKRKLQIYMFTINSKRLAINKSL